MTLLGECLVVLFVEPCKSESGKKTTVQYSSYRAIYLLVTHCQSLLRRRKHLADMCFR